jgi:hypothetical protein
VSATIARRLAVHKWDGPLALSLHEDFTTIERVTDEHATPMPPESDAAS